MKKMPWLFIKYTWQRNLWSGTALTSRGGKISEHEKRNKEEANIWEETIKEEFRSQRLIFNNSYLFSVIIKSLTKIFLLSYFHHSFFESLAKYTSQFRQGQLEIRLNDVNNQLIHYKSKILSFPNIQGLQCVPSWISRYAIINLKNMPSWTSRYAIINFKKNATAATPAQMP